MCNQASNLTFWNFSAKCEGRGSPEIPTNRSLMLAFVMTNCKWNFKPPLVQNEKVCLAVKQNCPDSELVDEVPLLPDLCSFYAFPVCPDFQTKNPHCDICKGKTTIPYPCKEMAQLSLPPSWVILFDFSSSSQSRKVGDKKSVVRNKECAEGFVFDPFNKACVQIHLTSVVVYSARDQPKITRDQPKITRDQPEIKEPNISKVITILWHNCSYIEMNINSVSFLSNGSIWIPLHKRMYNKERYFSINNSSLLLCTDFKRDYNETETPVSTEITPLQILTYIGCTISVISLIFLLGIYIALPELRTLPGKNLMNLSFAMLVYHVFFLLTGQTDKPNLCMTVSVLLHYLLLSSFCWMGVMAFDVEKTFAAKGNWLYLVPVVQ